MCHVQGRLWQIYDGRFQVLAQLYTRKEMKMAKFRTKHGAIRQRCSRRRIPSAHVKVVATKAVVDRRGGLVSGCEIILPAEHQEEQEDRLCDILQLELVHRATSDRRGSGDNLSGVLLHIAEQVAQTVSRAIESLDCGTLSADDVHIPDVD